MAYQTIPTPDYGSQITQGGSGWHPGSAGADLQQTYQSATSPMASTGNGDIAAQFYKLILSYGQSIKQGYHPATGNPYLNQILSILTGGNLYSGG